MSNSKHEPAADAGHDEWQPTRAFAPADSAAITDAWQATRLQPPVPAPRTPPRTPPRVDEWQSTRAQTALATQLFRDEDDYLATHARDIGRRTGADQHELFVSCDPAPALQQQFEHLRPEFIAVHDIATTSSAKLLAGIAAAGGRQVQRLVIRRQGHGTVLATLEFVELPTTDQRSLRVYSTAVDADTAARHGLALALLAFSRLGVVMVGELPAHAMAAAFRPLADAIATGAWPNRNLLLLPLATSASVGQQGSDLGRAGRVNVRTTPLVARPADAWSYITGTWNRLGDGAEQPAPALAPFAAESRLGRHPAMGGMPSGDTRPMDDQRDAAPLPGIPSLAPLPAAAPGAGLLQRYARKVSELGGVQACCIFDAATAAPIEHAARDASQPAAAALAQQGQALLQAMARSASALGLGLEAPDAALSFGSRHLLLRPLPRQPGLVLHAVAERDAANLTLLRLQLQRLDALFEEQPWPQRVSGRRA